MKKILLLVFIYFSILVYSFSQCTSTRIIYASPTGTAAGDGSIANPMDFNTARTYNCGEYKHIRLLHGVYNFTNTLTFCDSTFVDGDWEIVGGEARKNTNLVTTINIDPPIASDMVFSKTVNYFMGIQMASLTYALFQDLIINVKNGGASGVAYTLGIGDGSSVYGVHLNSCNNIEFLRCEINTGSGSVGSPGVNGMVGANGTNGGVGTNGSCTNDCGIKTGGNGGNGGGGIPGAPLNNDTYCSYGNNGGIGSSSSSSFGAGGGSGGAGGSSISDGGNGGSGGNSSTSIGGYSAGGAGMNFLPSLGVNSGCDTLDGKAGSNGVNGLNGSNGNITSMSNTFAQLWYVTDRSSDGLDGSGGGGGQGGGGGAGKVSSHGGSGGGGGGGGQGGTGGTGGYSSGGSFGAYLYNFSTAFFTETEIHAGPGLAGGTGGMGGNGGMGGQGGHGGGGSNIDSVYGCSNFSTRLCSDVGIGGRGGIGGNGGRGGNGGNGATGRSQSVYPDVFLLDTIGSHQVQIAYYGCTNSIIRAIKNDFEWNNFSYVNNLKNDSSSYTNSSDTIEVYNPSTLFYGLQLINDVSVTLRHDLHTPITRALPTFSPLMVNTSCVSQPYLLLSATEGTEYRWIIFHSDSTTLQSVASFTGDSIYWTPSVAGNYTISMQVKNECCGWSIPVYYDVTIGCANIETENIFVSNIFPNPTYEEVTLLSNNEIEYYEIYTLDGKLLTTQTNFNNTINLKNYVAGIYLVKVYTTEKHSQVMKVIKK